MGCFFDSDVTPVMKVVCECNEAARQEISTRWGWEEATPDWRRIVDRNDLDIVHTFVHAIADFLEAISKGAEIHPNFADGVKVMQILEAGLESAVTGRKVILQQ